MALPLTKAKQKRLSQLLNSQKVKTKPKPVKIIESETPPKQLTASELLQQSYNEMKR